MCQKEKKYFLKKIFLFLKKIFFEVFTTPKIIFIMYQFKTFFFLPYSMQKTDLFIYTICLENKKKKSKGKKNAMKYVLHTSSVVWEGEGNSNSKTCCKLVKIESYSLLKIDNKLYKNKDNS